MKVLLLGEYSRLHNTLKEGLETLGHDVTLLGEGDGFKNFPVDLSIRATFVKLPIVNLFRKALYKIFKVDLVELEQGLRFWSHLPKLRHFDTVQLINERPIKTFPSFERFLLKKLFKHNTNCYLLSCGADTFSVQFMLDGKPKYSVLTPYLENPELKSNFQYMLDYLSPSHRKTHTLILNHIHGIIASDFDYVLPLKAHPKFKGIIPNPINNTTISKQSLVISEKINIFLGINKGNRLAKGISYFEKAIDNLPKDISEKINLIKVSNVPYKEYTALYEIAHILLDQVFAYDQGYNALEAMARGKVVFTGAEQEFLDYYNLQPNEVCINALPDVEYLTNTLMELIANPETILSIGTQARLFIEKHHNYKVVAKKYLAIWEGN